ncbi:MAG: methyltransferase domain-containing protein [Tepidisphaera sp.]|nr:methyltransferase domain-containing protein [Tepidisphaera sp.]
MNTPERMAKLFDEAAASFDAIYSRCKGPVQRWWDSLTRRNIYRRFDFTLAAVAPAANKRVLDVGCGSGRYCVALAQQGAAKVVGLDVSPLMLKLAGEIAQSAGVADRCQFVQEDAMKYSPPELFDAVIAMGFFDYVKAQVPLMTQFRSFCRGRIIASFPCLWAWRVPVRWLWWKLHGWDIAFSTRQSILDLCKASGLRVVELKRDGPVFLLIAEPQAAS